MAATRSAPPVQPPDGWAAPPSGRIVTCGSTSPRDQSRTDRALLERVRVRARSPTRLQTGSQRWCRSRGILTRRSLACMAGVVTAHSLPSVIALARRFSDRAELSEHLAVELGALCVSTARMLVSPPLWWMPERWFEATTVVLIRISDVAPDAATGAAERVVAHARAQASTHGSSGASAAAGAVGAAVAAALAAKAAGERWAEEVLHLRGQLESLDLTSKSVTVESVETSLDECRLCAAALAAATSTHTRQVRAADGSARVVEQQRVDSDLLVHWLRKFRSDLPGLHERPKRRGERVVPLFLYSVAAEWPLLLEQSHLAVPHTDMVIAVQTRPPARGTPPPSPAPASAAHDREAAADSEGVLSPPPPPSLLLDEQCAGAPLRLDARDVTRPLLGALLQTGWGVSPSHVSWSAAHNASVTNLLWSVGRTPFGVYSTRAELSFALRDAAARGPLYAVAAEVMREVRALREFFREFGKEVDDVLTPEEHLPFLRRLNVLSFKLQRVRSYLSLHSFRLAQYYVLSTWHDLRAMRGLLEAASAQLSSNLVCE